MKDQLLVSMRGERKEAHESEQTELVRLRADHQTTDAAIKAKDEAFAEQVALRKIEISVGLVRKVTSHESATFRGGGGHFCGRVARSATRQRLLVWSASRKRADRVGLPAR